MRLDLGDEKNIVTEVAEDWCELDRERQCFSSNPGRASDIEGRKAEAQSLCGFELLRGNFEQPKS